ncbi:MAG: hypothetical protein VB144_03960 [Clostridia bacterium]|nr:hypothetical protein [Clostridia bacterium]
MKITELRNVIRDYSQEQLALLVTELYKAMPKAVRDEKNIDAIVQNPDAQAVRRLRPSHEGSNLCFDDVASETRTFIENASCQCYFVPNRVITKGQRPKWRFIVRRLYGSLVQLSAQPECRQPAAELVEQLYKLLCRACRVALFSTCEPFRSVGIPQTEFFSQVLTLKRQYSDKSQFVQEAVALAVNGGLDGSTTTTGLMLVFLEFLPIPDLKLRAIAAAEELKDQIMNERQQARDWSDRYETEGRLNHLTELAFHCYAQLGEFEKAIDYFDAHCLENDEEVKLYVLAQLLFYCYQQPELTAEQIRKAMARGVRPRPGLIKLAGSIAVNKKLPEQLP